MQCKPLLILWISIILLWPHSTLALHATDLVGKSCEGNILDRFNFCDGWLTEAGYAGAEGEEVKYYGKLTKLFCEDGKWILQQQQACGGVPEAAAYCNSGWCNSIPASSADECSSPICAVSYEKGSATGYGYVEAYAGSGMCQGTVFQCGIKNYCSREECKSVNTPEIHSLTEAVVKCCKPCEAKETKCNDKSDDDCDGLIDLDDQDCSGVQCGTKCCSDGDCVPYCDGLKRYRNGKCSSDGNACLYTIEDCNDKNICTIDTCTLTKCTSTQVKYCCLTAEDCKQWDPPLEIVEVEGGTAKIKALCLDNECQYALQTASFGCYTDSDCDDGKSYTKDTCLNPGTAEAVCLTGVIDCSDKQKAEGYVWCEAEKGIWICQLPRCSSDSDCNEGKFYVRNFCIDPGTCKAHCSFKFIDCYPWLKEKGYVWCGGEVSFENIDMTNKHCKIPKCTTDADCNDNNPSTNDICKSPGACSAVCLHADKGSDCLEGQIRCRQGWGNKCITPKCSSDNNCNDQDESTFDECVNPATCFAYCKYTMQITASQEITPSEKTSAVGELMLEGDLSELADNYIHLYNEKIDKVPRVVIKLFANERLNLYVDNQLAYSVTAKDGRIIESKSKGVENPTMNVYADKATIKKLITREISFEDALSKGYIKYKGVGFFKKIKFGLVKLFQKFLLPSKPEEPKETEPEEEPQGLMVIEPSNGSTIEIYAGLGYGYEPTKIKVKIPPSLIGDYANNGMLEYKGVDIYPTEFAGRKDKVPYGGNSFNPTNLSYADEEAWVPLYCLKDLPSCDANTNLCEYEWYTYHHRHGEYQLRAKVKTADGTEQLSNAITVFVKYPSQVRGVEIPLILKKYGGENIGEGGENDIRLPMVLGTYVPRYTVQAGLKIGYRKPGEEWKLGNSYQVDWPVGGYNNQSYVRGLYYLPYSGEYDVRAVIKEGWGGEHYSEPRTINIVMPNNFNQDNNIHLIAPMEGNELKTGRHYSIRGICPETLNYTEGTVEYKKVEEEGWHTFGNPLIFTHYHTASSSFYVEENICELTPWQGDLTWFTFEETGNYNMRLKVKLENTSILYSEVMTFNVAS